MRLGRLRYESKYLAIQQLHKDNGWSINWMCSRLGLSRAAYYKWLHREIPLAEMENREITQLIREYDDRFNHILGYRRMAAWINRLNGKHYSRNRIHRLMKQLKIHSVIRRKKSKYVYSKPETAAENTLSRDFNASTPNQKWVTDVTEFKWYEGTAVHKLYLSAILDLYDRSVVSYVVSPRNDNKLVFDTFEKAIAANPHAHPMFHSDRGFQYTSKLFQFKLAQQSMEQSMSRVSHCIDNCPTEGFWGIVKAEMYYLCKFNNEDELRRSIEKYIHFYNYDRYQERFGTQSPMEVRNAALKTDSPVQYPIAENKRIAKYKARFAA